MKNSRISRRRTLPEWLTSNWFNVTTLAIAALALIAAWFSNQAAAEANKLLQQANGIMLRMNEIESVSSSPNLSAVDSPFSEVTYMETGCRLAGSGSTGFEIGYFIADEFTIANRGGLGTSLVNVTFERSDGRDYLVKVYPATSFELNHKAPPMDGYRGAVVDGGIGVVVPTLAEPLRLPLDLEPGRAKSWYVQAQFLAYPNNELEARDLSKEIEAGSKEITWTLSFSDGSTIQIPKTIRDYSSNSNLYERIPTCDQLR